jgi:hypothetical protein
MSRKPTSTFEFSARCIAGSGLGAIPLHHVASSGYRRASHYAADAAGIATAGLARFDGPVGVETAFLAAARDGARITASPAARPATILSRLAALVLKLLPQRRKPVGLEGCAEAA